MVFGGLGQDCRSDRIGPTVSRQRKIERTAAFQADLVNVAQGSFHLSFAGHDPGIAIIDGVPRERT